MFVIADDEIEALNSAILRANELEIKVAKNPVAKRDGEYPSFDDFTANFSLVRNSIDPLAGLGGYLFGPLGSEGDFVRQNSPQRVWTLIESEDLWWITPGIHMVNRLGYLITHEERSAEERAFLYD
ncbi:MAG TPA: hypothetical protein VHY22_12795 [Chthoniobacteraceae bacterium]|nr:hypothetical protein [Chthoniobacteraceae bacterium]